MSRRSCHDRRACERSALDDPARARARSARTAGGARRGSRDDVRLLVSHGDTDVTHTTFADSAEHLRAGDALVVNTSATIPAAIAAATRRRARVARPLLHRAARRAVARRGRAARPASTTAPFAGDLTGADIALAGGGRVHLLDRFGDSQRLWLATPHLAHRPCSTTSPRHGEPIRYRHAPGPWPLDAYQQIFGREPGSAEMPSAARPFTPELVVDLVRRGVTIVPILLARRRVVARSARDAVPRALPRARRHRRARQRGARGRRARDRGRHHRRARARDRRRRARRRAPGERVDRARGHARARRARGRRAGHRLARARGHAPAHARGDRRAGPRSSSPTRRRTPAVTCGTSSATATCSCREPDR